MAPMVISTHNMISSSVEKIPSFATEGPIARVAGDTTPSSSAGDESLDDADKTLEALGYTPVRVFFLSLYV